MAEDINNQENKGEQRGRRSFLHNNVAGDYQYLSDSSGLLQALAYYADTTATETSAGHAQGYLSQVSIKQGETGTAILQNQMQYFARSDGNGTTVYRWPRLRSIAIPTDCRGRRPASATAGTAAPPRCSRGR